VRSLVAVVLFSLVVSGLGWSAPSASYTLYYIDTTHNVSKQVVNPAGHPVGSPKRLTTRGTYGAFSVSPDERYVVGMRIVRGDLCGFGDLPEWDQYVERCGKGVIGRIVNQSVTDMAVPYALWQPKTDAVVYVVPQQVNSPEYLVYSLKKRLVLFHETNEFGPVSDDQRYAFVTEDVGCAGEGPADLRVLDLTTGKLARVRKMQFEESVEWLGKTHRFAFIGSEGRVWAGEVTRTASGPRVRTWSITRYGGCTDLRYVPGKGIYFLQRSSDRSTRAYLTSDLRSLRKTAGLPIPGRVSTRQDREALMERILTGTQGAWTSTANLTADHKLLAVPVDMGQGEMPEIRVFTRDGKSVSIARGKYPRWKGAPEDE